MPMMMIQPVYQAPAPVYPVEYAPAARTNQSMGWSAPAPAQAAPASAIAVSPRTPLSRPIIRAKGADEPLSALQSTRPDSALPVTIPPPEKLGISLPVVTEASAPSWAEAHRELERLAAISYRLDKLAEGGCRFTCLLPTSQPGFTHRIEAEAATETEAVGLVLAKAREWVAEK